MSPKARLAGTLILAMFAIAALAQDVSERDEDRSRRRADKIPTDGFWPTQKMMERFINRITDGMADEYNFDEDRSRRRADKIPTDGFWPTQKMMERFINRITDGMADEYNFDDDQLETTRDLFKAQFPEFLNENRAEIQTLLNQYFEALLDDGPPAPEEVAEWAGRVQPLMAEFGEICNEVTEGMREYINDEQMVMLDAQYVAFQTGLKMVQNKLAIWSDGGYDPETEWIRDNSRRPSREEREAAERAAEEADAERAAAEAPKDQWTIYTEQFIERYQLNDEQKQKAFAFLRHQQEARDRYLRRNDDEMARVTRLLTESETEEERAASLEAYQRLNAPVDRIFEQLKDRLDTLPTRAQRKAVGEAGLVAEKKQPPTPESAPSTETPPIPASSPIKDEPEDAE